MKQRGYEIPDVDHSWRRTKTSKPSNRFLFDDSKTRRRKGDRTARNFVMMILFLTGVCVYVMFFRESRFSAAGIPKVEIRGRVMELVDGDHFDSILKDTPDEMRPPGLVAFYGSSTCPEKYDKSGFRTTAETRMPARERLFVAKYDVDAAPIRAWYRFTPERDLAKRFGVDLAQHCPTIVFVPPSCDGWTEWCRFPNGTKGCDRYKESCPNAQKWDGKGDWVDWAEKLIDATRLPSISGFLGTYRKQGQWLLARDVITTTTFIRNMFLPVTLPNFTATGGKLVTCPAPLYDKLVEFLDVHGESKQTEWWAASGTQNSFHVTKTFLYDLHAADFWEEISSAADQFMRPLIEEWSGVKNLQRTSFYGIREYHPGHWLRPHVDRIDQLVLSATICVKKVADDQETGDPDDPWPLTGVDWEGRENEYHHPPGTVLMYESAKFIHGRPTRNPQGRHLGAFLHYKPPPEYGWDAVAAKAQRFMDDHTLWQTMVSTPTVEPENPVITKAYGDGAEWDAESVAPAITTVPMQKSKTLLFENHSGRPLQLFLDGLEGFQVQCPMSIGHGGSCKLKGHVGQSYIWSEVPRGHHERDIGRGQFIPQSKYTVNELRRPKRIIYKGASNGHHETDL